MEVNLKIRMNDNLQKRKNIGVGIEGNSIDQEESARTFKKEWSLRMCRHEEGYNHLESQI